MAQPQGPALPGGVLCPWPRGRARAVTSASHCGLPEPEHPSQLRERGTWSPSAFASLYSSRSVGSRPSTGLERVGCVCRYVDEHGLQQGDLSQDAGCAGAGQCVAFAEEVSPGVHVPKANQQTISISGVRRLCLTNYGRPRRQIDGVRTSVPSCGA